MMDVVWLSIRVIRGGPYSLLLLYVYIGTHKYVYHFYLINVPICSVRNGARIIGDLCAREMFVKWPNLFSTV